MTRSVSFNGVTRFVPGGISRVRVDQLATQGVSIQSIGLLGEADGGAPGATSGLVSISDASRAVELFRRGPLVDAILLAFQSSADDQVPGGAGEVVVYKTNASTRSSVNLPRDGSTAHSDTAAVGSTTTVVNLTTGGLVVNALQNYWVDITLSSVPGTPTFRRRITANSATTLTVTPALPAAPVAGNAVVVRNNAIALQTRDYGAHTSNVNIDYNYIAPSVNAPGGFQVTSEFEGLSVISPTLGETPRMRLTYVGGTNAVAQQTVSAVLTTLSNTNIDLTVGGLTPAAHNGASVVIAEPGSGLSEQVKITSNLAGALTLQAPGISNEMVAALRAAGNGVGTVNITTVTAATATVGGANGVATTLTTAITGVTGDDLSITFPAGMTIAALAAQINTNVNYRAEVPNNVNGNLAFARDLDFGTTAANIQVDPDVRAQTGAEYTAQRAFTADIFDIISWINSDSEYLVASRSTGQTADGSTLALDALATDGPLYLAGGARGVTANSSFQAGFDKLLTREITYVSPLIDQDLSLEGYGSTATWNSVAAQLKDHVTLARGAAGLERGAFIGFRGNKQQIIAAANRINDTDVQLVCQNPTILSTTSELTEVGPRHFAVMAASMRAGVNEVALPLTNKFIRASSITQDSSWAPGDVTDSADFIRNGVMFAIEVPGQGFRWVRDMTTYVKDDHICWTEGSVRDAVRKVVYGLRSQIERKFTGQKGTPATIGAVKDFAVKVLEEYRTLEYIVDSTDPVTNATTRAYYGLKVTSAGDVLRLSVGIFPVPGINFELLDVFVSVPTQSA